MMIKHMCLLSSYILGTPQRRKVAGLESNVAGALRVRTGTGPTSGPDHPCLPGPPYNISLRLP